LRDVPLTEGLDLSAKCCERNWIDGQNLQLELAHETLVIALFNARLQAGLRSSRLHSCPWTYGFGVDAKPRLPHETLALVLRGSGVDPRPAELQPNQTATGSHRAERVKSLSAAVANLGSIQVA
jgi:hypothetical protein